MNPVFILYSYHIYDTILFFTIITGFSYYLLSSIYKKRKSDLIYLSIFIILLFLIRHTYSFLWLSLITIVFCKIYGYKIIKYFFIPLLVISIFQFKNFYFIGQAHYGAPYEVLNENLSFLKKNNNYEDSEILQMLFKSKIDHHDFISQYKMFNLIPSYQNNLDRKKVLDELGIDYKLNDNLEILQYLDKCSSYSKENSNFIKKNNSKIELGYLNFDYNNSRISNEVFEINRLNIEKEIHNQDKIIKNEKLKKIVQKCSNNNNWYGVKKINDLRKDEILDLFKIKPLVPIFILFDNITTALNSSLNYYMIEYNIGNNFIYFNILDKLYYPSLNDFIETKNTNYFLNKLLNISLTKLLILKTSVFSLSLLNPLFVANQDVPFESK